MPVTYRPLTRSDLPALAAAFGDWIRRTNVMHFEPDSCTLGAFGGETPVGYISTYPKAMPGLNRMEAYIDVIGVAETYRRQGIAAAMLTATENWARAQGCRRIRAWSTVDKTEAIAMWRALGFCLHPVYSGRPGRRRLSGYDVTKRLKVRGNK